MEDKRNSRRIHIVLPAWFKSSDTQELLSSATTIDISANGLCLSCGEKLNLGQELPLQITLPTGERLTIQTKVIWARDLQAKFSKEYRIGVKIIEPTSADSVKFVRYYTDLLKQSAVLVDGKNDD